MKPNIKKFLGLSVLLLFLVLLVRFVFVNIDSFRDVAVVNPFSLFFVSLLLVLSYIPVSFITLYLLVPLGVRIGFLESFKLSLVTGFYNLVTPFRGGMVARAAYLKRRHGLSYTRFVSSLAASYVLTFFVASFFGLVSLWFLFFSVGSVNFVVLGLFLSLFLSLLFVIVFSPRVPETRFSFVNRFVSVVNGWHLIKDDRRSVWLIVCMSAFQIILGAFSMLFQFDVFGVDISFSGALLLSVMGILSLVIGITPAGLGVTEAVIVFSASTLGITPVDSLSAALVGRFVSFIVLFVLGPLFSVSLFREVRK